MKLTKHFVFYTTLAKIFLASSYTDNKLRFLFFNRKAGKYDILQALIFDVTLIHASFSDKKKKTCHIDT